MSDEQIIVLAVTEAIDESTDDDRDWLTGLFLESCYPTWEAMTS